MLDLQGFAVPLDTQQGPQDFCPAGLATNAPSELARTTPLRQVARIGLPLRASNEHILIVRVARAQEPNGRPFLPSSLARYLPRGVAWISPQLRTSNDHSFIVGVP